MARKGKVSRKTKETDVHVEVNIDGSGKAEIATTIPFLDHMLELLAKHGFMDCTIRAKGDTSVDYHHLVEDVGISLGEALKKALGDKEGIRRYGTASVPMDESLCRVSMDISGRPYLVFNADFGSKKIRDFDPNLFFDFFKSLSDCMGITLHINVIYGKNPHHIVESVFKAFARALDVAASFDGRIKGVMSTKGSL
ncbi:MAG: imidazoleglycerol-phosphate dehydratase HisB [Deltaproteobacteria bacterium]|nr:imidazoleglycerol-phosphate dehydratase HisB [Deltaproteobacteria bacterium]MBN2846380.1 imidazoleglycerol-phosphate dehydratase HisB [Deltaproteobacteria bacterium]